MTQALEQLSKAKDEIIQKIEALPPQLCIAFAATCCERLIPNYQAFSIVHRWGDFYVLQQALNMVWQFLKNGSVKQSDLQSWLIPLDKVVPDLDKYHSIFVEQAMYAVDAVISTLQYCIVGEKEHVINVVEISTTTIETYLRDVGLPYTRTFISEDKVEIFDQWVWNSPLITDELDNQRRDLEALQTQATLTSEFLDELREAARVSGINMVERGIVVNILNH